MAVLLCLLLLLLLTGDSSSTYCVCIDGVSPQTLQKPLDYACGGGTDCSPNPSEWRLLPANAVKDHCNFAVNSYFQNKAQAHGSCDFAGTAALAQTLSSVTSVCVSFRISNSASRSGGATPMTPTTNSSPTTTPSIPPPDICSPDRHSFRVWLWNQPHRDSGFNSTSTNKHLPRPSSGLPLLFRI